MKIGNIDVTSMKIGSTNVAKAYVGSTQVYPSSQPTPTGATCNDLVLPDGDNFTANTTDKYIQISYSGVSSNDITVKECGEGYLEFYSINSNYIYLHIVNSPKDGDSDCITIRINGDKCANVYVNFVDSGGGLVYIPQGTDMTQYYYRTITRFKIGDSALPYGYQGLNINFGGQHGQVSQWVTNFTFSGNQVTSLPCDVSGSDVLNLWDCTDQNWSTTHNNPFTDLWIEYKV